MREVIYTSTFRRDIKRLKRQGNACEKLFAYYELFYHEMPLPPHSHDHALKGKWKGHRELHLESDWLLIYRIIDDAVYFVRTGSHAELFGL
jgi:mRNA interferase YafQ